MNLLILAAVLAANPPAIIPSPGTPAAKAPCYTCGPDCQCGPGCACDKPNGPILGKTATGWRVTYKSRQFDFAGESKAAASAVMAALVKHVDGEPAPKAMPAGDKPSIILPAAPSACGWQLVNGRWLYVCPNAKR